MKMKITAVLIAAALAFAGKKLIVHTSNGPVHYPLSTVDSLTFVEMGSVNDGPSVTLDNFERNFLLSDTTVSQSSYSTQSTLGYQLGGYVDPSHDSLQWGGGLWSAYASDNGARIYAHSSGGGTVMVIDSIETYPANQGKMNNLFGNDSLSVIMDCRSVATNTYWAGVSVNIAGDQEHLAGVEGVKIDGEYSTICWNLSTLESISVEGRIMGSVLLTLAGVGNNEDRYTTYEIKGSDIAEDFSYTIPMDDFTPSEWMGGNWSDIKEAVYSLTFDIHTEKTDYVELDVNSITLNFKDEAGKLEAFPFLAQ